MIIPSTPHFHDPSSCSLVMVKSTPKTASFSEPCFRSRKLSWARSSPSIATRAASQARYGGNPRLLRRGVFRDDPRHALDRRRSASAAESDESAYDRARACHVSRRIDARVRGVLEAEAGRLNDVTPVPMSTALQRYADGEGRQRSSHPL